MLTSLACIAAILALPPIKADPPRAGPPAAELKPVTVVVVDSASGAPIQEFALKATYEAPGLKGRSRSNAWTTAKSPTGTIEIQTPPACLLSLMVAAADYIGTYPSVNQFVVKSSDRPRKVVIRLRRGITVTGIVRDSQTKKPIAGVTVGPLIRTVVPRVEEFDEEKLVTTSADGRYEVRGVDPALGVSASHPDYVHDSEVAERKTTGPNYDIVLKRRVTIEWTIAATAVDVGGRPLEGVTTNDPNNTRTVSNKEGRLSLRNPILYHGLTFHKDGFIDRKVESKEIDRAVSQRKGLVVVMEPLIAQTGRVVAPDGRSVPAFTVAAGPGKLPSPAETIRRDVQSRDGRFRLDLSKQGTTWVGILAEGFAAWEGWVDVKRGGAPLEIRLSPGVSVSARVVVPEALRNRVKARLVPRRDKSEIRGHSAVPPIPPAEEFPTRSATCSADGTLRFEHVRPDRYRLIITGWGATETTRALDVTDAGLDVGAVRIDATTATGRIEGRVWHPKAEGGGVYAFAEGYVGQFRYPFRDTFNDEKSSIEFHADENGRFQVEGVPAGLTAVRIPYGDYHVIQIYSWSVRVVEGRTTVVGAFDSERPREFTLALAIGDGSKAQYESGTGLGASRLVQDVTVKSDTRFFLQKNGTVPHAPMFRIDLVPRSNGPLSFAEPWWRELDAQGNIVLLDVDPGLYRLRLYDWLGTYWKKSDPLVDQDVTVPPGGKGSVRLALGAGCITGKIPVPKPSFDQPVEVTAMAKGSRAPSGWARCDYYGNFCVRYLSPGIYSLWIHDPKAGFCHVDDVEVKAAAVDIGERTLTAGARVHGAIQFARPSRVPDAVVAVNSSGVSVRRAFPVYSSFDEVDLPNLWSGHWTITARHGDEVLAATEVDVHGTGTFPVALTAGSSVTKR